MAYILHLIDAPHVASAQAADQFIASQRALPPGGQPKFAAFVADVTAVYPDLSDEDEDGDNDDNLWEEGITAQASYGLVKELVVKVDLTDEAMVAALVQAAVRHGLKLYDAEGQVVHPRRPAAATGSGNLRVTEIKAFVPARNFEISKQFYRDLGFTLASEGGGVAYFHFGAVSFLLQDFCADALAENFMMHILVEDVDAWWNHVQASGVGARYGVQISQPETQPWRMRDFCLSDPSGVVWRIGQNTD